MIERYLWIILMIVGTLVVYINQVFFRMWGLCWKSVIIYSMSCTFIVSWMLSLGYQKAPNFLAPYFLSIIVLCIVGVIGNKIIFEDPISAWQWIGITLGFLSCLFLAK
jgi:drug/metabolite transporter (DMT)-like permease